MIFKYGTYSHPANTVDIVSFNMQRMYSPRNRLNFMRKTMVVSGHFCVAGQSSIRTTLAAFETAYLTDGNKDVALYHDDGTLSRHYLDTETAVNGVRVLSIKYPRNEAEYATGRSIAITFQADYLDSFWEDTIHDFQETLQFFGNCGTDWHFAPVALGPPVLVTNSFQTVQHVVQKGRATGLQAHPIVPAPLFPISNEHGNRRVVEPGSAQMIGRNGKYLYPISWAYHFSFTVAQSRYPHSDYPGH